MKLTVKVVKEALSHYDIEIEEYIVLEYIRQMDVKVVYIYKNGFTQY